MEGLITLFKMARQAGFGFGFLEIGAVTALAQPGNPKPRLYRLPKDEALINRLGFNNEGATVIAERLKTLRENATPLKIPLGINIGRSKIVETKDAVADFVSAFDKLYSYGDFFTLNVSSPNTPQLRDLQERDRLQGLLRAIQETNYQVSSRSGQTPKPILVKIAPDMDFSIDGVIQNNPKARANPKALAQLDGYKRPLVSSLSGNLQRFGMERVAKVESLQEIISEMTESDGTSEKTSPDCPLQTAVAGW